MIFDPFFFLSRLQQSNQPQQQQNRGHLDYNQSINCENQSDNEAAASNSLLKLNDEKPKLIDKTFHEDGVFRMII